MQELLQTFPAWAFALTIFVLRVIDMSLGTLRFLVSMRGKKLTSWLLGFFQSIIFVNKRNENIIKFSSFGTMIS